MLDRLTGRILHIDFGDCFEVAMTREKFPEKIPFRLTRMLTNAMEVGGACLDNTWCSTLSLLMSVIHLSQAASVAQLVEHLSSVLSVMDLNPT